jgi:hypothetical protein
MWAHGAAWVGRDIMPTPCKRKNILNLKQRQCPVEGFRVPCPPHPNLCSLCLLTSTADAGGHGCDRWYQIHRILGTFLLWFRNPSVDFANVLGRVRSGCMPRRTDYDPWFPFNSSTRESICGESHSGLLIAFSTLFWFDSGGVGVEFVGSFLEADWGGGRLGILSTGATPNISAWFEVLLVDYGFPSAWSICGADLPKR